jgi:hypothetical protein
LVIESFGNGVIEKKGLDPCIGIGRGRKAAELRAESDEFAAGSPKIGVIGKQVIP